MSSGRSADCYSYVDSGLCFCARLGVGVLGWFGGVLVRDGSTTLAFFAEAVAWFEGTRC